MEISSKLLVVGTKPEPDWVGRDSTLVVKFSAAENHNRNVGTREKPKWETYSTSWYNMEAWGDTAKAMLEQELDVGTAFSFEGYHKIEKVQKENEKARYFPKYKITSFEIYESRDKDN